MSSTSSESPTLAEQVEKTAAERYYRKHLEHVKAYQKRNLATLNEYNKARYHAMKENPEQYAKYLAYHREYIKSKRQKAKIQPPISENI